MKKIETISRKVFNAWELRSGYPSLHRKVFYSKGLHAKYSRIRTYGGVHGYFLLRDYESCSPSQFALPITRVKVMRHITTILLWKTEAAPVLPRVEICGRFKKKPARLRLDSRAAVPTWAVPTSAQISLPAWLAVWSLRLSAGLRTLCPPAESS